jgi:hypothetical protein
MPRDVARAALYRGIINLWVEDELSREYLSAVWNSPPDVFFLIGGGNEGVNAVVKDAESAGFLNVFGLVDRDFRPTNRTNWSAPGKTFRTFILPVHEVENYLLDSQALAASRLNTLGRTETQIEEYLVEAACRQTLWVACRQVVAELKHRFRDSFVPDPSLGTIQDEAKALDHICNSDWFRKLSHEANRSTQQDVADLLSDAHQSARSQLVDGSWRTHYAGKEVYHDVASRICDQTHLSVRGRRPSRAEIDVDLAKGIASWQSANQGVPHDLDELLAALRLRIAAAP